MKAPTGFLTMGQQGSNGVSPHRERSSSNDTSGYPDMRIIDTNVSRVIRLR